MDSNKNCIHTKIVDWAVYCNHVCDVMILCTLGLTSKLLYCLAGFFMHVISADLGHAVIFINQDYSFFYQMFSDAIVIIILGGSF